MDRFALGLSLVALTVGYFTLPHWMYVLLVIVGLSIMTVSTFWGIGSAVARLLSSVRSGQKAGPVYWTLTEAISWIAFGEPATSKQWTEHYLSKIGITPDEEKPAFDRAEAELFEKVRDVNSNIDILGRKDGKGIHQPIPSGVFLSPIGANILHDSLGVSYDADIGPIINWDGPNWSDVRIKRTDILRFWPKGGVAKAAPLMLSLFEAATRAYERTRGTNVAVYAELRIDRQRTSDNILAWYCFYIWQHAPLFGNAPPSRIPELIDYKEHGNTHDFRVVDNRHVILRDRDTGLHYENMHMAITDFSRVMKRLGRAVQEMGPESATS